MKYSRFTNSLSLFKYTIIAFGLSLGSCKGNINNKSTTVPSDEVMVDSTLSRKRELKNPRKDIIALKKDQPEPAADHLGEWVDKLKNKTVAVVGNQTSVVNSGEILRPDGWDKEDRVRYVHLVDTLLSQGVDIKAVFAPEHGFRGTADAGATIEDGVDATTGLPIISLYGKNNKPSAQQLSGVDIVVFDIQDVGARFYTYISTLHYIMEACAELKIPILLLDRPNPNGHYVDGSILEKEHQSFVGMHPVPVVHGMTMGEYASMINGEGWLENNAKADLQVIKCKKYTHDSAYHIPIKPSPNLPNDQAINLYPSLCFFEGTEVSVGRGTEMQFQVYGSPSLVKYIGFSFTPSPNVGAKRPKFNGKKCFGVDLREHPRLDRIELEFLVDAFAKAPSKKSFFNSFFTKLAGTEKLQQQIESGMSAEEIRASWKTGLEEFEITRKKYLLYP
ncbi:hypothetical protein BST97_09055 [Nonlabens spongiae]|uniref:DUF1343 domain-containing protein n=1 Tax=Nonlabens spongiae TaxID=331648 RepID=A0A1W6MKL7_9FLAO|nr:DUF1343 domain-containing protein [Nonlabens spongiae]ARN78135.1 hypothetical protein BST97_09055 [Nonlabens spongiae]